MQHFYERRTQARAIGAYAGLVEERVLSAIEEEASIIRGCSVVHINTTPDSGGVAEMLKSQVPLERSFGIDSRWLVMKAPEEFFEITKTIHNLLQGTHSDLSEAQKRYYVDTAQACAPELLAYLSLLSPTVVVLHDPQPLPLIDMLEEVPVIVRLHPDLSTPDSATLAFLRPFLEKAQKVILSDAAFRPSWLSAEKTIISYPAIDPFTDKNKALPEHLQDEILEKIGIDPSRPLVAQVSRFDQWKDPLGVIAAYRMAKREVPSLQLALGGLTLAADDPEAKDLFSKVQQAAAGDPDIHLFGSPTPPENISNDLFVNALQSGADVVVQKSTREGFGMSLTEAMWKGAAVIAGNARGLRKQVRDGVDGYIVSAASQCASRIVELITMPDLRRRFGKEAHKSAADRFLMPRLLGEFVPIYREALS